MRRLLIPVILLAGLLNAPPALAAAITFESLPAGSGFFGVNILITLDEGELDLAGFDFLVGFDPTAAALRSVTEGDFLSNLGDTFFFYVPVSVDQNGDPIVDQNGDPIPVADGSPLQLVNFLFGSPTGATGSGILASLLFEGASSPAISITPQQFVDSGNNLLDVRFVPPETASVPEPSALGLMGVGLLVLARRLRRKTPVAR